MELGWSALEMEAASVSLPAVANEESSCLDGAASGWRGLRWPE